MADDSFSWSSRRKALDIGRNNVTTCGADRRYGVIEHVMKVVQLLAMSVSELLVMRVVEPVVMRVF